MLNPGHVEWLASLVENLIHDLNSATETSADLADDRCVRCGQIIEEENPPAISHEGEPR